MHQLDDASSRVAAHAVPGLRGQNGIILPPGD